MPLRSLFLAILFIPLSAFGQQVHCIGVVSGRIVDEHDNEPLSFASVSIPSIDRTVEAAADGTFRIDGVCSGKYSLRVAHIGCEPVERAIQVGGELWVEVRLEHHAEQLREAEIIRSRPDEYVGQAHHELDASTMERNATRTLAEMLSTLPGVNMLTSGPTISKPIIHGLSGNRILTLNQGIRQEDQQWGTEHAPNLDPLSSDRITVVKGAASVQYGSDALGGVIITEPVELPRTGGVSGELAMMGSWNGRGGGGQGLLQGGVPGVKGVGWRVQGSGRYMGDGHAADYVLSNTGLREAATSASIGYRDHRRNFTTYYSYFQRGTGILRAAHIGNLTDLEEAIARGRPWYVEDFTYSIVAPRQTAVHHLLKLEAGIAVRDRGRLVGTYGFQTDDRQEYDRRRAGRDAVPALDMALRTHTADLVFKHWLGGHIHGKLGVNGLLQTNENIAGTGVRPLIPNYLRESVGVFVIEHMPLGDRVETEVGARVEVAHLYVARYDDNDKLVTPHHHFRNHAFSAGLNWSVKDSLRVRFNIGSAYRPPHVSELYSEGLHHGAAAIELGDDALGSERSLKATGDIEVTSRDGRLRAEGTLYVDRIKDFIYLRPDGLELTIRGAFPQFSYIATDVRLIGADAMVQYHPHLRWTVEMKASTVRARDLVTDQWLFQMPSDRCAISMAKVVNVANGGYLQLSATGEVVLRQVRIPVGLDFMDAPRTYHLFGVSAKLARDLKAGVLQLGISASNVTNSRYRDMMDRFRYYADARGVGFDLWLRLELRSRSERSATQKQHPH